MNCDGASPINSLFSRITECSELTAEQLIQHHSHAQYRTFAPNKWQQDALEKSLRARNFSNYFLAAIPVKTPRYCERCLREDKSRYGIPYWHRLHQLPGVEHCIKHNVCLRISSANAMQHGAPQLRTTDLHSISTQHFRAYIRCPHIQSFASFSEMALRSRVSFNASFLRKIVDDFATEASWRGRKLGGLFPVFWLQKHFPGWTRWLQNTNAPYMAVDPRTACQWGTQTLHAVFAMTLCWDDPESELVDCLSGVCKKKFFKVGCRSIDEYAHFWLSSFEFESMDHLRKQEFPWIHVDINKCPYAVVREYA
jgi:TniQ